ncbi:beta-1,3-galactosyl-O-glycosyl-glycoprotein beta-1,6-N-acetylglucosaminyltransferase 4 [Bufo gargarizans]|uniref:beta-1,3-galactosyl-O-glycosyl-glycoprotein beta-1,6-N-acetylglucosaminyltransferase 4 n=1 Tax=Bufo gargarizans TaxID=30331 RepID=UPI001CF1869D|nr:beta-1,3-galactosyl-O-glycosyl-glycoprotein beta-1,6-N-acetylglucosaminyltransferase 4 [Bufo gargarizans]XP_044132004.1 beta-1,3-galactosyl-O-glycosyl-glycoprotein beta-1,6-N-acetylglucosaminyltransferase 4 [Bufo gargarizans]XP_044132005.1 beta-1,3-galactosyl-O-glycosyl-glycoprotein beta-1,6-N-acetylglucosaminyltransferase 4 [Bufo gargarizans]XP_044132006.1 beta-1,3-galactosyl-O-glycosyl-glycoprotein beta-1,6-N-acetylglucosaminyltransferase 4 [Bufo gargarizans]XP_044132008.1 beta-1,3-galacto
MKKPKSCLSCFQRQKVTVLLIAVSLLCILKLLRVELIFPRTESYFVEPNIFSSVTNNFIPNDPTSSINCTSIYELEPAEIGKSLQLRRRRIYDLDDSNFVTMTNNCDDYKKVRHYHEKPISQDEKDFPIAYSLVVHKDAISVERLLYSLYSPTNIYCIHYDQKSSSSFKKAMINLANCFPNVFIASKLESVIYAHFSRLQADLNCLSDLLKSPVQWKYGINLCGQDMPLKSNYELVSELKKLNGKNMLETTLPTDIKRDRYTFHHEISSVGNLIYGQMPMKTFTKKSPPPEGIEMYVGSAYFVLSRPFIQYVFESPLVAQFLEWSKDTYSPDEHFWATLIRVPGAPGGLSRTDSEVTDLDSKTRLVKWIYLEENHYPPCTGTHVRSVCIYGAAELRWLLHSGHWFANKFDPKVDPILIKCLIEKIEEQQRDLVSMSFR